MKPVLAVATALVLGWTLPLGTGAALFGLIVLAWVVLSVPVSLFVGRMFSSRRHAELREQRARQRHNLPDWQD